MSCHPSLLEISDLCFKEISSKIAHLDMREHSRIHINPGLGKTIMARVHGDYELFLLFFAEKRVLDAIAENMKRSPPADDSEVAVYVSEFFNILCGRVVSTFNTHAHVSARFRMPEFVGCPYEQGLIPSGGFLQESSYHCSQGTALFQAVCFP